MGDVRMAGNMSQVKGGGDCDMILMLEDDTEELTYQVAGHTSKGEGLLKHKRLEGYIMKPVQKGPLGQSEVNFYKKVDLEKDRDEVSALLKSVIPDFRSLGYLSSSDGDGVDRKIVQTEYLILEDIARGFELPCVLDVKMGQQTWDPRASETKIKHEKAKYVGTRSVLGVSIPGIQYYNINGEVPTLVREGKEFGRSLDVPSLYKALQAFLNKNASGAEKIIASLILEKLEPVKRFFTIQENYAFYASSLLITYDAQVLKSISKNGMTRTPEGLKSREWLRIRMIDFAHTFPGQGLDANYILALTSLLQLIESIQKGNPEFEFTK